MRIIDVLTQGRRNGKIIQVGEGEETLMMRVFEFQRKMYQDGEKRIKKVWYGVDLEDGGRTGQR